MEYKTTYEKKNDGNLVVKDRLQRQNGQQKFEKIPAEKKETAADNTVKTGKKE